MSKDDKIEFIGQIIDIFEDNLDERTNKRKNGIAEIRLYKLDTDSEGVYFGGNYYDNVSNQLIELFRNWNIKL